MNTNSRSVKQLRSDSEIAQEEGSGLPGRDWHRAARTSRWLRMAGLCAFLGSLIACILGAMPHAARLALGVAYAALGALAMLLPCYFDWRLGGPGKSIRPESTAADLPCHVGPLLEAYVDVAARYVLAAWSALEARLTKLLTGLQPDDGQSLSSRHHRMLAATLRSQTFGPLMLRDVRRLGENPITVKNEAFVLAILKALGEVGGEDAIGGVAAVAHADARTDAAIRVQRAAIDCLAVLRERLDSDHPSLRLLRPSDAMGADLLRPAFGAAQPDEDALLRPADATDNR